MLAVELAPDFKVKNPPVVNTPAVGVNIPVIFKVSVIKVTPAALLMVMF